MMLPTNKSDKFIFLINQSQTQGWTVNSCRKALSCRDLTEMLMYLVSTIIIHESVHTIIYHNQIIRPVTYQWVMRNNYNMFKIIFDFLINFI